MNTKRNFELVALLRYIDRPAGTRNRVDWRLLVKEHIAKIAKLRIPFKTWSFFLLIGCT